MLTHLAVAWIAGSVGFLLGAAWHFVCHRNEKASSGKPELDWRLTWWRAGRLSK